MLALFLAMINLSNADPSPVTVPPTHIGQQANALDLQTPFAAATSESAGDVSVTSCTYGVPQLTPRAFDDALTMSRLLTTPPCAGTADFFGRNFQAPLVPFALGGLADARAGASTARFAPLVVNAPHAAVRFAPLAARVPERAFASTGLGTRHVEMREPSQPAAVREAPRTR